MGYLPQEESIFRKMTVEQNILAILETLPLSKAERRNRCDQLLHQFGIERIAKNTALTLSGGETATDNCAFAGDTAEAVDA